MAHVSIDIPGITQGRKKELINEIKALVAEKAEIEESSISVSIHELPVENMSNDTSGIHKNTAKKEEQKEKTERKKSIFKEMFP